MFSVHGIVNLSLALLDFILTEALDIGVTPEIAFTIAACSASSSRYATALTIKLQKTFLVPIINTQSRKRKVFGLICVICLKVKRLQDSYHKNVPRYTVLRGIHLGRRRTVRIPDPMRSSSGSAHTCHSAVQSHSASRDTDPSGYRSHQLLCRCRVSYKRTL